jgi:hypothetical protein
MTRMLLSSSEGGKRESMWVMVYLRILFLAKVQINDPFNKHKKAQPLRGV